MRRIYLIVFLFIVTCLSAQDLHFSQYNENPSLLNPALTGAISPIRAAVNYRDQWKSVNARYRTIGADFEVRTPPMRTRRNGKYGNTRKGIGRFGAGVSVYKDQAGDGLMGLTMANFNLATFVALGKRHVISAGFQASMVQRQVEYANLVFPNQFAGTGYDNSLTSGEKFDHERYTYADYGAGFLWSYGQDEKTFVTHRELKARIGVSIYHFMEPVREFIRTSNNLVSKKYVAHGDLLVSVGGNAAIAPSFMVQLQEEHMEAVGGLMFRLHTSGTGTKYNKHNTIGIGGYYRNSDAVIVSLLLEMQEKYAIGLSYDINVSNLSGASKSRGGFEITLRYSAN